VPAARLELAASAAHSAGQLGAVDDLGVAGEHLVAPDAVDLFIGVRAAVAHDDDLAVEVHRLAHRRQHDAAGRDAEARKPRDRLSRDDG